MSKNTILLQADKNSYAIPAFNYSDVYELLAIVEAAREARAPVYVASNERTVRSLGIAITGALGRQLQNDFHMEIINHLDHATNVELCLKAIDCGYASVMIDASQDSLVDNIRKVKQVVEYAHPKNVLVEAEVGKIKGNNIEGIYSSEKYLAEMEDAIALVSATHVDSLAIGLGTSHGFYNEKPKIHLDRLEEINNAVNIPLVLHGGTGIPREDIIKCIKLGISKVNVGTILHYTYLKALREKLGHESNKNSLSDIFDFVKKEVKKVVKEWIEICMAGNHL